MPHFAENPIPQNTSTPVFPGIYDEAFFVPVSSVPGALHNGKYLPSALPVPSPGLGPFHKLAHSLLSCGPGRQCLCYSSHSMGQHTETQRAPVSCPGLPLDATPMLISFQSSSPLQSTVMPPLLPQSITNLSWFQQFHHRLDSPLPEAHIHPKS